MRIRKALLYLAAVVFVAGCSNGGGSGANEPAPGSQRGMHAQAPNAGATVTQASSISSEGSAKMSSMSMQQAPGVSSGWLEWLRLDRFWGNDAPQRNPLSANPPTAGWPTAAPQNPPTAGWPAPAPKNPPAANPQYAPPAAGPQTENAAQFPQQVFDLVNRERSQAGLAPLRMSDALSAMATDKAQDMVDNNYFDHQSPTYGSPFQMMDSYGIRYQTAGENIAKGQRTPTEVMNAWMNSEGHRANILNGSFTEIGIGYYNGGWVQVFTG